MSKVSPIEYSDKKIQITEGKPAELCEKTMGGEAVRDNVQDNLYKAREKTIAYRIMRAHEAAQTATVAKRTTHPAAATQQADPAANNHPTPLHLKFDALVSHDITYVSIIQTARAAGMTKFPIPYALTNCHNSLCAVGGTINEDDHAFGLSAAKKYGGIYVPANQAVIHQYARETLTGCGKMILGSDSHTRYGCYGTMGVGEGGGELVKQLLEQTYDIEPPKVTLVWLENAPRRGIGPHDVALALIKETFPKGKVKNQILEFAGPGVKSLPMDYRIGIDVMTTETSCLSSIWETDETVREFYKNVGRENDYKALKIAENSVYDAIIKIDLSKIEAMIALPFHPSNAYTIHELQQEPERILREAQNACNNESGNESGDESDSRVKLDLLRSINSNGEIACEQGIIVGCSGGMFDNISEAADILSGESIGNGYFDLSVYPSSAPISLAITARTAGTATTATTAITATTSHGKNQQNESIAETLIKAGAVLKPAFCGPCFGAGDTPAHNTLSIRHATRNFASREGSKPANGQITAVALMDARSIAATAKNGGILTAATDIEYSITPREYVYDGGIYEKRCYNGFGKPNGSVPLRFGPNITDWPKFTPLKNNLLVKLCAVINDDVTTTDELIPSGETSSYRSNPIALAEFTLSRRAPEYVKLSKATVSEDGLAEAEKLLDFLEKNSEETTIGSCIFAKKPGDGSAREQAASCQRVLGGRANICYEYATKRYRSNCINWGIVPFTTSDADGIDYAAGDWIFVENIREVLLAGAETISAKIIFTGYAAETQENYGSRDIVLKCENLSEAERIIITEGCLINYYDRLRGESTTA